MKRAVSRYRAQSPTGSRRRITGDGGKKVAIACARAADDKLAERTVVLDLSKLGFVANYLVIATASSPPHFRAIAGAVEEASVAAGGRVHHREGDHRSPWLLIDLSDVIVHVFDGPARAHYDLERLWAGAKPVHWEPRPTARAGTTPPKRRNRVKRR